MKNAGSRLAAAAAALCLAVPAATAQEAPAPPPSPAAAAPQMVTYYMGFLVRGPRWTPERTPEVMELQKGHLAHMRKQHELGKLILAGPFGDDGRIRGIVVYKTDSMEEAIAITEQDPSVKAGRLAVEFHPWLVQKGILP